MNPKERLALLFKIWRERATASDTPTTAETYGEECAAYLIELDATTDGEKLFSKAGDSL